MKLRKGDTVKVIAGKDRGQEGEVVQVFPTENKVLVNGINTAKKHSKARRDHPTGRDHRPRHARRRQQRDVGAQGQADPRRLQDPEATATKVRVAKRTGEVIG